ncbi:MAG: 50S ribosomal protein L15, partial [Verrucomicrobiaceae bacterium]|nr:50S ribosomal protein L15 [Verrucomicrobiaceae bacterium]
MRLHDLKPSDGATHRRKRRGCGESSGLGKTSGRGHKGQKSRSGGGPRSTFEGGQMPLYRRLPKRGFNNKQFKDNYAVVNVATLDAIFEEGAQIDEAGLRDAGVVKGCYDGLKILGSGSLNKKFSVTADKVSASAKLKIEEAGGSISLSDRNAEKESKAGKA